MILFGSFEVTVELERSCLVVEDDVGSGEPQSMMKVRDESLGGGAAELVFSVGTFTRARAWRLSLYVLLFSLALALLCLRCYVP